MGKLKPSLKFQRNRMTHERGGASAKSRKWPNPLFGQKLTCPGVVPAKAFLMSFRFSNGSKSLIQLVLPGQNFFERNRRRNAKGHFWLFGCLNQVSAQAKQRSVKDATGYAWNHVVQLVVVRGQFFALIRVCWSKVSFGHQKWTRWAQTHQKQTK